MLAAVAGPFVRLARKILQYGIRQEVKEDPYNYVIEARYFGEVVSRKYLSKRKAQKDYE